MLGPERLPRVVSEMGRWVGRARAMARQFREQLEEEVQLEQARRTQAQAQAEAQQTPPAQPGGEAAPPPPAAAAAAGPAEPERTPTYSHAHPTDATGASTLAAGEPGPTPRPDERGT